MFIKEITHFMKMSEREQKVRLSQHVPSIEEYWQIRMGTSAVGVCAAVIEFVKSTASYKSLIATTDTHSSYSYRHW